MKVTGLLTSDYKNDDYEIKLNQGGDCFEPELIGNDVRLMQNHEGMFQLFILNTVATKVRCSGGIRDSAEQLMNEISMSRKIGFQRFRESASKGSLDEQCLQFHNSFDKTSSNKPELRFTNRSNSESLTSSQRRFDL